MIDASSVDLNKSGTYKVKLTYKSSVKEVEITIIEGSTSTYFITINNELSTTLDVGTTDVDFKQFFFIKDSNGNSVEVLDSMIDLSNVNLGEAGTFTITIKYQDLVKDLLFNVVAKDNDIVYEDFDLIFDMMKDLELDNKGTATSEHKIKVKGTVYMDVISETSLVYLTDGKNFVKLHGEKIHNYTAPNSVYEVECYYKSHIYQPTFEVINPSNDIKRLAGELIVGEIEVKEVTLSEILALKRENFALNISNGYLQSMLKIKGYLQLDTHNSSKYDYCLTIGETYTKNNTGYINNGLYFKNDVEELDDFLLIMRLLKK